jgi:carbamoyltransferase
MKHILGISAFYHDSAAVLLKDGIIIAAAQEERFTRRKNDENFPINAIMFCLKKGNLRADQLDAVAFYDKPITKFARMLETYLAVAPGGWKTFPRVLPTWLSDKLNLKATVREAFADLPDSCPILFTQHHESHAASAFYPSPFNEAAILTIDGVGEWATTTMAVGNGNEITTLKEIRFPHSLGLLYSTFTAYCGFRVNSGEYKLMGLAPYGEPKYVQSIYEHLIDVKPDGSFWLNMEYFDFLRSNRMSNDRFYQLFGGPPREPETKMESRFMDVARSIQQVTEDIVLKLAKHTQNVTEKKYLCLAGGVALNCVANGKLIAKEWFDDVWIQPAAGDAGGALGAALAVWHQNETTKNHVPQTKQLDRDHMSGSLLGPSYDLSETKKALENHGAIFHVISDEEALLGKSAQWLNQGNVVGWMQGAMEFGPRALGNRSILGDARSSKMQSLINRKIKFRESFRPFAPAVMEERAREFFDLHGLKSPYMLLVAELLDSHRKPAPEGLDGLERLHAERSDMPAITHVDYSARVQTVNADQNPRFYKLLKAFESVTGCPMLINTSFNVRGEPIVTSPDDAYRCFMNTEMDYLVIGNVWMSKKEQSQDLPKQQFIPIPD